MDDDTFNRWRLLLSLALALSFLQVPSSVWLTSVSASEILIAQSVPVVDVDDAGVEKKKRDAAERAWRAKQAAQRQKMLAKERARKAAAERKSQEELAKKAALKEKLEREEAERQARLAAEQEQQRQQEELARQAREKEAAETAARQEKERLAKEAADRHEKTLLNYGNNIMFYGVLDDHALIATPDNPIDDQKPTHAILYSPGATLPRGVLSFNDSEAIVEIESHKFTLKKQPSIGVDSLTIRKYLQHLENQIDKVKPYVTRSVTITLNNQGAVIDTRKDFFIEQLAPLGPLPGTLNSLTAQVSYSPGAHTTARLVGLGLR